MFNNLFGKMQKGKDSTTARKTLCITNVYTMKQCMFKFKWYWLFYVAYMYAASFFPVLFCFNCHISLIGLSGAKTWGITLVFPYTFCV